MRPCELTLKGFRSYRTQQTFSFEGRRLVGIVGPIGAGKSSILDAVAFALYGRTPTFGRSTKSLIHQLEDQAQVEMVFEVDGGRWRVQRGIRKKGPSGHKLQHLASAEPDAAVLEHVDGERNVLDRVERLLGMDFEAFSRSVLLAQNRFQDFLHATPKDRDEVLKGVFGYERLDAVRETAKGRVAVLEERLRGLAERGEAVGRARGELPRAREQAKSAETRARGLRDAAGRIAALDGEIAEAEARAARARDEAGWLEQVGSLLREAGDVEGLFQGAAEAGRAVDEAEGALQGAEATRAAAEDDLTRVRERIGDRLETVAELVTTYEHLDRAAQDESSRLDRAAAALDAANAAVTEREAAAATAQEEERASKEALAEREHAAEEAERALHEARHADMARSLRGDLHTGEPCPVCEQTVTTLPPATGASDVDASQAALEATRSSRKEASRTLERASASAAKTAGQLDTARADAGRCSDDATRARRAAEEAAAALGEARSALEERLGEGDPRELLAARAGELDEAKAKLDTAQASERAAREALEAARSARDEVATGIAGLATRIAQGWGILGETREVPPEPDAVSTALTDLGGQVEERLAGVAELLTAAGEGITRLAKAREEELGTLGLEPGEDLTAVTAKAQASAGAAAQQVAALETTIAEGADLEEELARATRGRDLAVRLERDLRPSNFLAFLLEEERAELAEIGSEHLEELSGGTYRFSEDDRFDISDLTAAGMPREAKSLSGGETFLASLALALALADMVTRGGGRLDAFFLDEGFGSLDPEHIDRAMAGIERIVTGGGDRLVVLVSHVAEMREAIDDLIVLDKDRTTGDTVVRDGSGI